MRTNRHWRLGWVMAILGACILLPIEGRCQLFHVKLKNGTVLTLRHYYEKNGTLFFYRSGNYIGIERSDVLEIIEIEDKESLADSAANPKRNSRATSSTSSQSGKKSLRPPARQANRAVGSRATSNASEEANLREREESPEEKRLRKIEELESKIDPLREESEKACKGAAAIASGNARIPGPNTAEGLIANMNVAANTVEYCVQKTRELKKMEKDLDALRNGTSEPEPELKPEREPVSKQNSKKSRRRFL
jgi:hypothetical protein